MSASAKSQYGKLTVNSAPSAEPVSVAEVKTALRIDQAVHDTYLGLLIKAAREFVEIYTRRTLITTTLELRFRVFPAGALRLSRPPVQSVTTVQYRTGVTAAWTTLAASGYHVDIYDDPPFIEPEDSWPSITEDQPNHVLVTYLAGYGAAGTAVPEPIRQAIIAIIGDVYEFPARSTDLINGLHRNPTAELLLNAYRRVTL